MTQYLILDSEMGSGPQGIKFCADADALRKAVLPLPDNMETEFGDDEWWEIVEFDPTASDLQGYDPLIIDNKMEFAAKKLERFIRGGGGSISHGADEDDNGDDTE